MRRNQPEVRYSYYNVHFVKYMITRCLIRPNGQRNNMADPELRPEFCKLKTDLILTWVKFELCGAVGNTAR